MTPEGNIGSVAARHTRRLSIANGAAASERIVYSPSTV